MTFERIRRLHHNAYRCRDSEETRKFYEDFLGLPLAGSLRLRESKSGRAVEVLHTFYELGDGSYLAFFEAPLEPFTFKPQADYDLHIALEIQDSDLKPWMEKGEQAGIETRGVADHDFIHSIYFRDPNGYVIELTARQEHHAKAMDNRINGARERLDAWQATKQQIAQPS